jgi:iron complex outermembrane recepter protein
MDKRLLFNLPVIFFLFKTFTSQAQTELKGTVIDLYSGNPIAGVHIQIFPSGEGAASDTEGNFEILSATVIDSVRFTHVAYNEYAYKDAWKENIIIKLIPKIFHVNEIVVEGFNWKRSLIRSPASIAIIDQPALHRYNQISLVPAVNTIPGVRMEERSPGSYRFSIRGSLLRSPFGVRNIKVYWNEVPLTDAGGNTHLNLIDINTLGRIEVIKGPAASMYGAGTGGVVMLQSNRAEINKDALTMRGVAGSYGLFQGFLQAATSAEQSAYTISYAHQQRDGYRHHSKVNRKMLTFGSRHYAGKNTLLVNGFFTDHFYEIPGGIDFETFNTTPTSARQGSEEQNSSIKNKTFLLGVGNELDISNNLKLNITLYGSFTDFDHPFILDYKRNTELGLGGRSTFSYRLRLFDFPSEVSAGGEYQQNFVMAKNYMHTGGVRDSLILDDEITSRQYFGFLQVNMDLPAEFYFSCGMSFNRWNYNFIRVSDAPVKIDYVQHREFNPVVSPRVSLLKSFKQKQSIYASISWGFSPPSVAEIRTSEGSLNTDLEAEKGINYETGFKGIIQEKFDYTLTFFSLQLNQTIVSRTSETGVVLFSNSGNTMQNGLELAAGINVINNTKLFLSALRIWASYSYSHFRFKNYQQNKNDFSGNELTGIPANVLISGVDLSLKPGLYMHFTWNYTDKIPLNDANTVYSDPYHLLTGRLGVKRTLFKNHMVVSIFTGIDNLLDEKYSLGNDLNAFGGRYYQPAPGRNYYTGLSLTLRSSR